MNSCLDYSMRSKCSLVAIAVFILQSSLIGCGGSFRADNGGGANFKSASEERILTAPHVSGSSLDVHIDIGSVEVITDPSSEEVQVSASVKAFGETDDEARSLLKDVHVDLERRADGVLTIDCRFPQSQRGSHGACSFKIRVPEAKGARIRTGNGSVTLKGISGVTDIDTGIGNVTISDQTGKVVAHSGNGAIQLSNAVGDAELATNIGSVTVQETSGAVTARSGNGAIIITGVGGDVDASTDIGSVTIQDAAAVIAKSGNGSVSVVKATGTVRAKTSIGQVKLEQVSGVVEAESGNGSVIYVPAAGSDHAFTLKTAIGSVNAHLPASAAGSIDADTTVGAVTINGSRQPRSVNGDRSSKQVVLSDKGPTSKVHTGNGSITITLD